MLDNSGRTAADGRVLTDAEVKWVCDQLLAGESTAEVAKPFGRTTGWSSHLARASGLLYSYGPGDSRKRWRYGVRPGDTPSTLDPSVAADIVGYLLAGKSAEQVSDLYTTSRTFIRDVAHRAGYECFPRNHTGTWMPSADVPKVEKTQAVNDALLNGWANVWGGACPDDEAIDLDGLSAQDDDDSGEDDRQFEEARALLQAAYLKLEEWKVRAQDLSRDLLAAHDDLARVTKELRKYQAVAREEVQRERRRGFRRLLQADMDTLQGALKE